jgi:uncharacterized protein YbjT (DUF2867 family)
VIHLPAPCTRGAVRRLFEALGRRGVQWVERLEGMVDPGPATLVCAEGLTPEDLDRMAPPGRGPGGSRLLVLSRIGAHPDARARALRALWALEEHARASGLPVLTLRLGPLVGPRSPLWLKLAGRPRLPHGGRHLLNPVCEEDVVETLDLALSGRAAWEGWHEVAGPEIMSLAELAALAAEWPEDAAPGTRGAWEPPLEEIAEHRLCEASPWLEHFGIAAQPLAERAAGWFSAAASGAAP